LRLVLSTAGTGRGERKLAELGCVVIDSRDAQQPTGAAPPAGAAQSAKLARVAIVFWDRPIEAQPPSAGRALLTQSTGQVADPCRK
jgi:hypothetical protein